MHQVLAIVTLLPIARDIVERASGLSPAHLRALDAIHIATALSLGRELGIFIAYDQRLKAAADAVGLVTLAPA
jgi:predicted nucleic acid-binding protein